jgi:hypothetical protein
MSVIADHRSAISKKVLRLAISYRKHIVIEIKILLIKTWYPMQMHFNRITVESRKKLMRNDILMKDYVQLRDIDP